MAKQTKGKDMPTEPAVGTPVESLRERKRRETRAAIERSAIKLVDELGYENVTVAMIAGTCRGLAGHVLQLLSHEGCGHRGPGPARSGSAGRACRL